MIRGLGRAQYCTEPSHSSRSSVLKQRHLRPSLCPWNDLVCPPHWTTYRSVDAYSLPHPLIRAETSFILKIDCGNWAHPVR